ncbi:RNA polymerase subunit sigma-24 [Planobispora rosea]|uniref:RNA polymerase subunit sigma-24 n=1 Tax=Planobispora rosea TaxID=35762 RepID=A0A8J3RV69_PLARO|nr:RNA polymerase sigma factor [Planobispora rosea]GGS46023.1 RNA polymerase subunit sigma-24 [Planobispora rosea]GIH82402.1 RNA polymerase subunit sigma-24 [Planobispora rosea]
MDERAAETAAPTGPAGERAAGPATELPAESAVEAVFREERGRLLAALARRFGDLDLAEEVTSEAIEAALVHWPVQGVPPKPGAWLMTTARRKAVDRLRRDTAYAARLAILGAEAERADPVPSPGPDADLPDERLQLFFTCAHPALPAEDRVALTLRCLAGLTTPEVARAFLVPAETMAKRIVRAKKKIREARIPFRVPGPDELPERLPGVLQVVYSVFTEGYAASSGPDLQRRDLAEEAVRLARILRRLLPAEREVAGLLGLMLLVHARRDARIGPGGELVLLDDQDRGRWDRTMIEEGRGLVVLALTGGPPGPYGVQAAIAALHDEAVNVATTDWPQIVALYDVLLTLTPSPVVALNRAAAVAMRDGPEAGLTLLDELAGEPRLRDHHPYPMARADLLSRLGRFAEAATAYREALGLAGTEAERAHLRRKLDAAESAAPGGAPRG